MQIQQDRQYYIDWLRAGAMFLLVFFHSGRLFDYDPWHIKNATENFGIHVFLRILDVWQMPLFFLVAGSAAWFSLGRRSSWQFTRERISRVLVPLIFGILVIVPPQVYLERIYDGDFTGSFFAWYPHTFQGHYSTENAASGNLSFHHLWFLAYLFVFSLLLLPLFRYLRREDKKPVISGIAGFLSKSGTIYLPAVPLIVYNVFLMPIYGMGNQNLYNDWRNFLFYITVFFLGFLMVSDSRITQVIRRNLYVSLTVAVLVLIVIYLMEVEVLATTQSLILSLYAIDCWLFLLAFLAIGMKLLNFTNGLLRYANDAVLPVYILHHMLIIVIGFYVIQWDIPVVAKYFFVVVAVFLSSLAIYEVVRRINVTRFLFGIKVRKRLT
jgi:peptidoglycan/LPS O-acetylase OafA/YrhL